MVDFTGAYNPGQIACLREALEIAIASCDAPACSHPDIREILAAAIICSANAGLESPRVLADIALSSFAGLIGVERPAVAPS